MKHYIICNPQTSIEDVKERKNWRKRRGDMAQLTLHTLGVKKKEKENCTFAG